jgi:hypothetical protein
VCTHTAPHSIVRLEDKHSSRGIEVVAVGIRDGDFCLGGHNNRALADEWILRFHVTSNLGMSPFLSFQDSGGSFALRMCGEKNYRTDADEPKVMDRDCEVIGRPKGIRV